MIEFIKNWTPDFILNFEFNSWLGLGLYWLPLVVCAVGYALRIASGLRKDYEAREGRDRSDDWVNRTYNPDITLGYIVWRVIVTVCPVVNLWSVITDIGGELLGKALTALDQFFRIPLIPDTKHHESVRETRWNEFEAKRRAR